MRKSYTYKTEWAGGGGGESPTDIVRWMRRNFGERGIGWDFTFHSGNVILDIWDHRLQVMWETFKEQNVSRYND